MSAFDSVKPIFMHFCSILALSLSDTTKDLGTQGFSRERLSTIKLDALFI